MQTIEQSVRNVITEIRTPSTNQADTPTVQRESRPADQWFNFQTFDNPHLQRMVKAAARFVRDIEAGKAPYWLSLLGPSGTGKTYLAKQIFRWDIHHQRAMLKPQGEWCYWPDLADLLQGNTGYEWARALREERFVVVDEIGSERDPSGHVADKLASTLCARMDKWTIITSNLGLQRVEQRIDSRVASRLLRGRNVCIELPEDTPDFVFRSA